MVSSASTVHDGIVELSSDAGWQTAHPTHHRWQSRDAPVPTAGTHPGLGTPHTRTSPCPRGTATPMAASPPVGTTTPVAGRHRLGHRSGASSPTREPRACTGSVSVSTCGYCRTLAGQGVRCRKGLIPSALTMLSDTLGMRDERHGVRTVVGEPHHNQHRRDPVGQHTRRSR